MAASATLREIAFGLTTSPSLLVARPDTIPVKFPHGAMGRISDEGELLLGTTTVENATELRHVRDGNVTLTERPDSRTFYVDDDMTHALVFGNASGALYDLATEELEELGEPPRNVEFAGDGFASSALFLVDNGAGVERLRLATHERTTIANDLAVHGIAPGRGNDLFIMDKSEQLWLYDLRRDTKHVVTTGGAWVAQTESGAWLVHAEYAGDQRYPGSNTTTSVWTISALDRDGVPLQSLTNAITLAPGPWGTARDNVIVWRNPGCPACGDLAYELWYMNPELGTKGRISRGFHGAQGWPKTSHVGSVTRPVGHEVFYTELTENGPVLRGAALP